jgi:histidinol-phosphate/aromatic aminotransferase/cobyric acid decarboxylase-like protein
MEKSRLEKGGFPIEGINLALCENPLPPIDEAIEAAKAETYLSNHYEFARKLGERNIHIRPLHHERLENSFLRFATSTPESNRAVLDAIRDILKDHEFSNL